MKHANQAFHQNDLEWGKNVFFVHHYYHNYAHDKLLVVKETTLFNSMNTTHIAWNNAKTRYTPFYDFIIYWEIFELCVSTYKLIY